MTMFKAISAIAVSLIACVDVTQAYQAWGSSVGNDTSITLFPIDTSTGSVSRDELSRSGGSLVFSSITDLASDPSRHPTLVWAVRNSTAGNELIAVDPYQERIMSYAIINASSEICAIAIDPLTGVMYGTSEDSLYTIDAFSGESTLVGPTAARITSGLGFDGSGRLYGLEKSRSQTSQLLEIDTTDASLTVIASVITNGFIDIATDPQDGVMYGLGVNGYRLSTINLNDGTVTTIGNSLGRPSGLAFTMVPEPTSATIAIAAVLYVIGSRRRFLRRAYQLRSRF